MGLLDDAIREHLELKRKHGANPEDVARQEDEALGQGGPRAEFAQPAAEPEAQAPPEPEAAPVEPPPAAREPEPEPQPQPGTEEDPWLVEELADPEPPRRPEAGATAAPEPVEGEDVLEETPEFLQETPEHERLWFEQKPPRDFDWDG